jgi:cysteine desulfurase/selenocysteine lyase
MKSYKKDFPIFTNHPELAYLDSAATSQKPQQVLDAIMDYYKNYNANAKRGIYPIAEKTTLKVEEVREKIKNFINAKYSEEIIFTHGTTEGVNTIMNTFGDGYVTDEDDVVTTIMEHHSNFVPWQFLAGSRFAHFYAIDITDEGYINEKELLEGIKYAKILAITYVSNMLGTINNLKEIIAKVKKKNPTIKVFVDAAQAAPHIKIDVQDIDCDFLAFSGHKMLASTGIGILYGKKELLKTTAPFLFGGEMIKKVSVIETTFADLPHRFEAGTLDIAGIVSLGAAIDYIYSIGFEKIREHERELIAYCLAQMEKISAIKIYGPKKIKDRCSVISFTIDNIHAHDVAQILGDNNICVRAGHHCTMPLHERLGIAASTRVSFQIYNDEKDVDTFIEGLKKVKKIFKK